MDKKPWIAFFSQTGGEIADIAESLQRWPDVIITNHRPEHLRTIDERILEKGNLHWTANKPELYEYTWLLDKYEDPIITLHGWLRVVPETVCNKYNIFNGHPGLITEFPELKGKDPQVRAFEGKYKTIGSVLHKVVKGVDEGDIISEAEYSNDLQLDINEIFHILRNISLSLWTRYLKKVL